MLETFGRVEDQNRLRTILEDAAGKSRKLGKPIFIGCDAEGNAAISPGRDLHIFGCAVDTDGAYYDNVEYKTYTLEEAVSRTYDFLDRGILEYGPLRFLSEGRMQLDYALNDARGTVEMRGMHFILGYTRNGITLAPQSEESRFCAPLSCVGGKARLLDPLVPSFLQIGFCMAHACAVHCHNGRQVVRQVCGAPGRVHRQAGERAGGCGSTLGVPEGAVRGRPDR